MSTLMTISKKDYDSVIDDYMKGLMDLGYSIYPDGCYTTKDGNITAKLTQDVDGVHLTATLDATDNGNSYSIKSVVMADDKVVSEKNVFYSKTTFNSDNDDLADSAVDTKDTDTKPADNANDTKKADSHDANDVDDLKKAYDKGASDWWLRDNYFDDLVGRMFRNWYLF